MTSKSQKDNNEEKNEPCKLNDNEIENVTGGSTYFLNNDNMSNVNMNFTTNYTTNGNVGTISNNSDNGNNSNDNDKSTSVLS